MRICSCSTSRPTTLILGPRCAGIVGRASTARSCSSVTIVTCQPGGRPPDRRRARLVPDPKALCRLSRVGRQWFIQPSSTARSRKPRPRHRRSRRRKRRPSRRRRSAANPADEAAFLSKGRRPGAGSPAKTQIEEFISSRPSPRCFATGSGSPGEPRSPSARSLDNSTPTGRSRGTELRAPPTPTPTPHALPPRPTPHAPLHFHAPLPTNYAGCNDYIAVPGALLARRQKFASQSG